MNLQHSKVQRGGLTSRYWYGQTTSVSSDVDSAGLKFRFNLPSKGGGETYIQLTIDPKDLRNVLKNLATEFPSLADTFAESTKIAVLRLMKSEKKKGKSSA